MQVLIVGGDGTCAGRIACSDCGDTTIVSVERWVDGTATEYCNSMWRDGFIIEAEAFYRQTIADYSANWPHIRRSHCRPLIGRSERPELRRKQPQGPCVWGRKGRV